MAGRRLSFLVLGLALLFPGCRKSAPETGAKQPETPASSAPAVRHRMFGSGVSPAIVRITPDTLPVRSGHAYTERYALEYDILGVEKADHGRVVLYSPGIGQVQAFDFTPSQHGTIEFTLEAGEFDFGPALRIRAKCPQGTTDWYTLGTQPMEYNDRTADVFRIGNVNPQYINRASEDVGAGAAV